MFTPLITHNSDGAALAAPSMPHAATALCTSHARSTTCALRTIACAPPSRARGHLLFDGGMGTMLQAAGMKAGAARAAQL